MRIHFLILCFGVSFLYARERTVQITNKLVTPARISIFDAQKGGLYPSYLPTSQISEVVAPSKSTTHYPKVADRFFVIIQKGSIQENAPLIFEIPTGAYVVKQKSGKQIVIEPVLNRNKMSSGSIFKKGDVHGR